MSIKLHTEHAGAAPATTVAHEVHAQLAPHLHVKALRIGGMKLAFLEAVRVLGKKAPVDVTAVAAARVAEMVSGLQTLANGPAVTSLAAKVAALFDDPELKEGRRSYRWTSAVPIISYAPEHDGSPMDTRKKAGRVETSLASDDVIIVVTRHGLRQVSSHGFETGRVDAKRLADNGISLDLLTRTIDKRLTQLARGSDDVDALPMDVPMAATDLP